MRSEFDSQEELDRMRMDPDNYKWGIFYFNPQDPRIFLPKKNPFMGYTLNFANMYSWLILIIILTVTLFIDKYAGVS